MAIDIEEELTKHGSDLSLRAARYIRLKRLEIDGLRRELRAACELGHNLMTQLPSTPETSSAPVCGFCGLVPCICVSAPNR